MKRLLWKEWCEWRWLLFCFVLSPLAFKFDTGSIFLPIIYFILPCFWGASRMGDERVLRWLPADPWKVWIVKFIPGLAASALLPLWVYYVAVPWHIQEALRPDMPETLGLTVAAYTTGFTLGTLFPTITAVVASTFVVILTTVWSDEYPLYSALEVSGVAVAVSLLLTAKTREVETGKRRIIGIGAIVLCSALVWGIFYAKPYFEYRPTHTPEIVEQIYSGQPKTLAGKGAVAVSRGDMNSMNDFSLRIIGEQKEAVAARAAYTEPLVWLPDGDLIFAKSNSKKSIELVEWDAASQKSRRLATFANHDDYNIPVRRVCPNADGSKLAVFASGLTTGTDLWIVDRAARTVKLVRPQINADITGAAWDGERLVIEEYDSCSNITPGNDKLVTIFKARRRWKL